jgi:Predicted transcriptional regulators
MNLKIGEKIKELREKADVTQSKMAAYLGITEQAISRWENGGGYPDMELIPAIANFLDATTDELFETDRKHERLASLKREVGKKITWWDHESNNTAIKMYRDILKEFPNDYETMWLLCVYLGEENYTDAGAHSAEIISLTGRIIADSPDMKQRRIATSMMAVAYRQRGERDAAIKIIKESPTAYDIQAGIGYSLENQMVGIAVGDEKADNYKTIINALFTNLCRLIRDFSNNDSSECKREGRFDKAAVERNIMLREKIDALTEIFYEDGDLGFHNELMLYNCGELAEYHMQLGGFDKALDAIEKCARTAINFDCEKDGVYTSVLAENCRKDGNYALADYENAADGRVYNQSYRLVNFWFADDAVYAPISGTYRFKATIAELEKYAKVETK